MPAGGINAAVLGGSTTPPGKPGIGPAEKK